MASPALLGIHHLKFPVADLDRSLAFYDRSLAFYERALGAQRIAAWDHRHADGGLYALILEVAGLGTHLELRLDPVIAERHAGFDPVTLAVQDRSALDAWIAHLDAAGIALSPALVAIQAWLVVFADEVPSLPTCQSRIGKRSSAPFRSGRGGDLWSMRGAGHQRPAARPAFRTESCVRACVHA